MKSWTLWLAGGNFWFLCRLIHCQQSWQADWDRQSKTEAKIAMAFYVSPGYHQTMTGVATWKTGKVPGSNMSDPTHRHRTDLTHRDSLMCFALFWHYQYIWQHVFPASRLCRKMLCEASSIMPDDSCTTTLCFWTRGPWDLMFCLVTCQTGTS